MRIRVSTVLILVHASIKKGGGNEFGEDVDLGVVFTDEIVLVDEVCCCIVGSLVPFGNFEVSGVLHIEYFFDFQWEPSVEGFKEMVGLGHSHELETFGCGFLVY